MEDRQISFRSPEVREIVTQVPHWIISWGITAFFLIFALIIFCSCIVHYPDIIKVPFRLTSVNSPKSVITKVNGKLIKLFTTENALVNTGQILGYIESTGNHHQILALDSQLNVLSRQLKQSEKHGDPMVSTFNQLGEVQPEFQRFIHDLQNYLSFQTNGYYYKKKYILEDELKDLNKVNENLEERKLIYLEDMKLAKEEFEIQNKLAEQEVISSLDLKRETSKLLSKRTPLKEIQLAILTNNAAKNEKQKEILEINKSIDERLSYFLQSLNTLKSTIDSWKSRYILTAPANGKVFFATIVEENDFIPANQEIFYISTQNQNYYGEVHVPQFKMGKVQLGQNVLIKFNSYPFTEYGIIKGKLSFISQLPAKENSFLAKVEFTDAERRSTGRKEIIFKSGMTGTAEIVTADMLVIEKIFHTLRRSLDN